MKKNEIIESMSIVLKELQKIYKKSDETTRTSIKKMTRTFICVSLEEFPVNYISIQALKKLKEKDIDKPFNVSWKSHRNNRKEYKELTYEHCVPLTEIISEIYDEENKGEKKIAKILKKIRTAWITEKENKDLNKGGYRQNRHPIINGDRRKREEKSNWKKCYKECNITVCTRRTK